MDYMPEQYREMQLRVDKVNKINCVLDGINIIDNSVKNDISPTIYINMMYEQYLKCNDLQRVLEEGANCMVAAMRDVGKIGAIDYSTAKDNIVFQLINTEQNKEMLLNVPHREFLDLSIVYRWITKIDELGIQSTLINSKAADNLGLSEGQLFKLASVNTKRILSPTIVSLNEIFRNSFIEEGIPEELVEEMISQISEIPNMYVISNNRGINGAASVLYEDKLHTLSQKLNSDLYVMPSSIHEVICISSSVGDPYELASMVNEINMTNVTLEERLSNQVYHYDKDLRKLTLATDTPNKRLDCKEA